MQEIRQRGRSEEIKILRDCVIKGIINPPMGGFLVIRYTENRNTQRTLIIGLSEFRKIRVSDPLVI